MKILKKIAGYSLLFTAGFLSFAILKAFLNSLLEISAEIRESWSGGIAYFLGSLIVVVLVGWFIKYLWITGNKLIGKKDKVGIDSIDDIGKVE